MIYNDKNLRSLQDSSGVLAPFHGEKRRSNDHGKKAVSFGLSQAGYDITLSPERFLVFTPPEEQPVFLCPKLGDVIEPVAATLQTTEEGNFFWLPPHCSALGASVELFTMPTSVMAFGFGKSTYARLGIIANITPIEPGWSGYLTISIVNPTPMFARIWANEGIAQIVFVDCGEVSVPYSGAYQNQAAAPMLAAV